MNRWFVLAAVLLGQAAFAQSPAAASRAVREFPMATIREQCPEFTEVRRGSKPEELRDCQLSEFAEFGSVDGQSYYYALYCLVPNFAPDKGKCGDGSFNAGYHHKRGLAIFVREGASSNAKLLFERVPGDIGTLRFEPPKIIRAAAGTLLYLPIAVDGTGHFNESEYFIRVNGAWERIEAESWLKDLGPRIPAGLGIWKGVWPDLETMTAVAYLYRPDDGNCCPSGGTARIGLAIQARRFVMTSVVIGPPPQ